MIVSSSLGHEKKLPVEVKNSATLSADKSAGDGVYVVFKLPLFPKDPPFPPDQEAAAAKLTDPEIGTEPTLFLQKVLSFPAPTTGDWMNDTTIVSRTGIQFPVELKTNVKEPCE